MAKGRLGGALRDVQTLFKAGTSGGLTDGQLLEEFRDRGGEARRARLRGPGRAARPGGPAPAARSSATSTRRRTPSRRSSSSWRGRPARCGCATRWPPGCTRSPSGSPAAPGRPRPGGRATSGKAAERADPTARDPAADDLGPVLHEEIDRLPDRYRAPIVLCFLEGLTREQAAGQLRWPLGTLQSRLARGRERLRDRLIRRGLAPSAILPDAVLRAEMARPVVPAALADAATRAALASAAGRPAIVGAISAPAALTEEVLKAMWFHKLKMIAGTMMAGTLLAAGVVATGAARALPESSPIPAGGDEPRPAPAAEDRRRTRGRRRGARRPRRRRPPC